mgnify:CR=1 FL=1
MGKNNKRQIEKALLRAFQEGESLEEVESESLLHGGSLKRLKKKKPQVEQPFIVKDSV